MNRRDSSLFSGTNLLIIGAVAILLSVILFPWKTAGLLGSRSPSDIKEQFSSPLKAELHELLDRRVVTTDQVLLLADKLAQRGLWKQSQRLLNEKLELSALSEVQNKHLATMQLRNYLSAYYVAASSNAEIEIIDVKRHLQYLDNYKGLSEKELIALAKISIDFRLLPQAINIYRQLAKIQPNRAAYWTAMAGKWYVEAGDFISAANALREASELSNNHRYAQAYVYAWLNVASKAGLKKEIRAFLQGQEYHLPRTERSLEKLAKASLEAGMPDMASNLYAHLSTSANGPKKQKWLEKAAYWAVEAEEYGLAENYLSRAYLKANNAGEKWAIDQRLIEVYVKSGRPKEALERIEPIIKRYSDNESLLKKGIELAFLEKDADLARRWNRYFLDKNPNDVEAITAQADIETLDKETRKAIGLIKQAIRLEPKNTKLRERWAYLEESDGNPSLATDIWKQLHQKTGDDKHQQQVIRLAESNLERGGLRTLLDLARIQPLPQQAINDVYFFLNAKQKDAQAAGEFISGYIDRHGSSRETHVLLAKWHADQKQYDKALETWALIEKQHGGDAESRLTRLELLWATERKQAALKLWKNTTSWGKKLTVGQQEIFAELAWMSEDYVRALRHYKVLLAELSKGNKDQENAKKRTFYYHRIALSLSKSGSYRSAIRAFKLAYRETGNADILIDAMQLSFDQEDMATFEDLVSAGSAVRSDIEKVPRFWVLQGAMALQQKQLDNASDYYQQALSLEPGLKEAVEGLAAIKVAESDIRKQVTQRQLLAMQEAFNRKDFAALARYVAESENNLRLFANEPQYWLLRGALHTEQKRFDLVLNDYLALLRIDPQNIAAIKGILLALRSTKNKEQLRSALTHWESLAMQKRELWVDVAISWQLLEEHGNSIRWFEMALQATPRDPAIMINYASSLEKLGEIESANELRQLSMNILQRQLASGLLRGVKKVEASIQYLGLLQKNGTTAQFDQLFQQLLAAGLKPENLERLYQIGISFVLDKNDLPRLTALLRQPFVASMKKPVWMQLSIALKQKNRRSLHRILREHSEEINLGDRVAALIILKREQEAFDVAKRGIRKGKTAKDRKLAYQLARSLADGRVSEVAATLSQRSLGSLSISEKQLQYKQGAGKGGLPAGFDVLFRQAELQDPGSRIDEQDVSIGFNWKTTAGQLNGRLGLYDNGRQQKPNANLSYSREFSKTLSGKLEAGFQETPEENAFLRANGRRNRVLAEATSRVGENGTAQLALWQHEFKSIDGDQKLASGTGVRGSWVQRKNSGDIQWFGGIQATLQRNQNTANIDPNDALPESERSLNLIAGVNRGTPGQGLPIDEKLHYSGSFAVGKTWPNDDVTVRVEAAVAKPLWKDDEISLRAFYDRSASDEPGDNGVMLKYRKFLDFPTSAK